MDIKDFISKVNWEGGLDGAFLSYGLDPNKIILSEEFDALDKEDLVALVEAYQDAARELEDFLMAYGLGEEEEE